MSDYNNEINDYYENDEKYGKSNLSSKNKVILILPILLLITLFAVGFSVIHVTSSNTDNKHWEKYFIDTVKIDYLPKFLKNLTSIYSLAGTKGDWDMSKYIDEKFKEFGIKNSKIISYYPLLAYPISRELKLKDKDNVDTTLFTASLEEAVLDFDPTTTRKPQTPTFNGYSPSGHVIEQYMYVNYGSKEDYEILDKLNLLESIKGKIVIARYGHLFRGMKVLLAEKYGAKGIVLYSDPADTGFVRGKPYNEGGSLGTNTSVQRGSIDYISYYSGDPLSPGKAATSMDFKPQYTVENAPSLPKIPCQPVSWSDIKPFLEKIDANPVKNSDLTKKWQGGVPDVEYSIGPSLYHIELNLKMNLTRTALFNVEATIEGEIKDEYILIGNHHDSWSSYNAIDPHSGTMVLLELGRVFGQMIKSGWKPKRTIKLLSWSGEEYGLIGSTEYVEDKLKDLQDKAVLLINTDEGSFGSNFEASATPSVAKIIHQVTKEVYMPDGKTTVYNDWMKKSGAVVDPLGSGTDYTPFFQYAGISSVNLEMAGKNYGVYHSIYDSLHYYETQMVDGYKNGVTLSKVLGLLVLRFASNDVLPFVFEDYAVALEGYAKDLENHIKTMDDPSKYNLDDLNEAIVLFKTSSKQVDSYVVNGQMNSTAFNKKAFLAERQFLTDVILTGRKISWYKHTIFAAGLYDGYGCQTFPGLAQAVFDGNLEEFVVQKAEVVKAIVKVVNHLTG